MGLWTYRQPVRPQMPSLMVPLPPVDRPAPQYVRGWTEYLTISGQIQSEDRLSDLLNRREPVRVEQPKVVRGDMLGWPQPCGEEMMVDPFEFDVVFGGPLDPATEPIRMAKRIHKVRYPVRIDGSGFVVTGTMHLFPGMVPDVAAEMTSQLFLPLTGAKLERNGIEVPSPRVDVVLVNRFAIQNIRQVDAYLA